MTIGSATSVPPQQEGEKKVPLEEAAPLPEDRVQQAVILALAAYKEVNDHLAKIQPPLARAIFLLGNAGVGKTALACALCGEELKGVYDPDTNITTVVPAQPMEGLERPGLPHLWQCPDPIDQEMVSIVDCPGLDDTRGAIQQMSNAACLQRLFDLSSAVHLLVIMRADDLIGFDGGGVKELVAMLDRMFEGNTDGVSHALSLVVTRAEPEITVEIIQEHIRLLIEDLAIEGSQRRLLESLGEQVSIFSMPQEGEDGVISTAVMVNSVFSYIRDAGYIPNIRMKLCLSDSGKQEVLGIHNLLVQEVNRGLGEAMRFCSDNSRSLVLVHPGAAKEATEGQRQALMHFLDEWCGNLEKLFPFLSDPLECVRPLLLQIARPWRQVLQGDVKTIDETLEKFDLMVYLRKFVDGPGCSPFESISEMRGILFGWSSLIREIRSEFQVIDEQKRAAEEKQRQQGAEERLKAEQPWCCVL